MQRVTRSLSAGLGSVSADGRRPWASERFVLSAGLLVGLAILVLRSRSTFQYPQLWAEDGTAWFGEAYDDGWLAPLVRPHAGYLQSFPRLVADVGLILPLRFVPHLFVLVAALVQVAPAVLL